MNRSRFSLVLLVVLIVGLFSVSVVAAQNTPRSYLILANGNNLPNNLVQSVANAGGTITTVIPEVGIAVAQSSNPNFSNQVSGVRSVVPNLMVDWIPGERSLEISADANPPSTGDNDPLMPLAWGLDAVNAPEAWNAGQRGQGVRVAVLDSGLYAAHPDLNANVNFALSRSFVPGQNWATPPTNAFNHGTHVAGTIGAVDNNIGVVGVAPQVELIGVQVLAYTGSGSFDWLIEALVYVANNDVDVANMSLGATLAKNGVPGQYTARDAAELRVAISRATTYAYQRGVTLIVSEGNSAIDKDHTGSIITLPADAAHVISIAATAPNYWATPLYDGFLDYPSSYTNFGRSAVDFAAPGGDFDYPGNENCSVIGIVRPCWVFDMVFSTDPRGYSWAAGTSMAAPHASGIAAIIIGENGGSMSPAHVEAELRARAEQLGASANDPYYGQGRLSTGY